MDLYTAIRPLQNYLESVIVGQDKLLERLFIALFADGHLLVEGAPGLAKTKAIKTLASGIEGSFQRIQFTPDLLPADITGTEVYHPENNTFAFRKGPVFENLILADEINRAPAKVQSALLESMAERQVSIGRESHQLPKLFMVMATQNPLEQEGVYPLPEAQLDRFLMHIFIDYPDITAEKEILKLARGEAQNQAPKPEQLIPQSVIFDIRQQVSNMHIDPAVENYIVQLVDATRNPSAYDGLLADWLEVGASPRGTISLERSARVHGWMMQRDYVTPDDVQSVAHDVLRHRLISSYEAQADGVTNDNIIDRLLQHVAVA